MKNKIIEWLGGVTRNEFDVLSNRLFGKQPSNFLGILWGYDVFSDNVPLDTKITNLEKYLDISYKEESKKGYKKNKNK